MINEKDVEKSKEIIKELSEKSEVFQDCTIDALQIALSCLSEFKKLQAEVEELKKLNDNLTRNVFVEDSPALKVMVEIVKQQKDQIDKLTKEA